MVAAALVIGVAQLASGQSLPIWDHAGNSLPPYSDPAYADYGTLPPVSDVVCSDTDLSNAAEEPSCPPPSPHGSPVRGSDTTGEEGGPKDSAPSLASAPAP